MKNENSKISQIIDKYNDVTETQKIYKPNSEEYIELGIEAKILREVLEILEISL